MNPSDANARRRLRFAPSPEALETRQVMTAGAGNTVAILPGQVAQAGAPAEVKFTIDPANFTFVRGRIALGIDVAAPQNSPLLPGITSIQNTLAGHVRGVGRPSGGSLRGAATDATITNLAFRGRNAPTPVTYTVKVAGEGQTTGAFLLGLYLPGDANGDGKVEQADLKDIRARIGAVAGDQAYSFDADSNRDGVITRVDLGLAQRNLGAKSTIAPLITSNLDPATDTGTADRVTAEKDVRFTGVASGGATITYSEINGRTPAVTTTATPDGTYSLVVPLALGLNRFRVTATDTTGQVISGTIDQVDYNPVLAAIAPSQHQAGSGDQ